MRKFMLVVSTAAFILAGCVDQAIAFVKQIQDTAVAACGYLPAADFVNELLGKPWPQGDKVLIIVAEICNKVAPPATAEATRAARTAAVEPAGPLYIQGVLVRGHFVVVLQ